MLPLRVSVFLVFFDLFVSSSFSLILFGDNINIYFLFFIFFSVKYNDF